MAKDFNDKTTLEAFEQTYIVTYTCIKNNALRRAVLATRGNNEATARVNAETQLTAVHGNNYRILSVKIY